MKPPFNFPAIIHGATLNADTREIWRTLFIALLDSSKGGRATDATPPAMRQALLDLTSRYPYNLVATVAAEFKRMVYDR